MKRWNLRQRDSQTARELDCCSTHATRSTMARRAYPFRYFRRYLSEPVTETPNARSGDAPRPMPYVFHRRRAPSYAPKEVSIYIVTSPRHVAVSFLLILLDQQREKRLTNGAFRIYDDASLPCAPSPLYPLSSRYIIDIVNIDSELFVYGRIGCE